MKTHTKLLFCILLLPPIWGWCDQHIEPAAFGPTSEPNGAETYIYRLPPAKKTPVTLPAFTIGKPKRLNFVFFTAEEEEALWNLLQKRRQEEAKVTLEANRLLAQRNGRSTNPPSLVWPRVVVRDLDICVPDLAHSEDVDWADHLLCWAQKNESN